MFYYGKFDALISGERDKRKHIFCWDNSSDPTPSRISELVWFGSINSLVS